MYVSTKHVLLNTDTDSKEVAPHTHCQSQGWNLAPWAPLAAGGRALTKISGHILLSWVISVLLFYPPCGRKPGLVPLCLTSGKFVPGWEVEGVWSPCFLHALRKVKLVERIGLLVPGRETRVSEDPRMRGRKILLRQGWDQRSIYPSRRKLSAVPYQCLIWLHGWSTKADI